MVCTLTSLPGSVTVRVTTTGTTRFRPTSSKQNAMYQAETVVRTHPVVAPHCTWHMWLWQTMVVLPTRTVARS
jgi:hypothetical protein